MWKVAAWLFKTLLIYLVLCVSLFLMSRTILNYLTFQDNIQFLAFKQDYVHIPIWKTAFYIHVFTAFLSLAAGLTQFSSEIRQHHPWWHRRLGHVYVWNILVINFPTALVMAIYANGGWSGKAAFLLLDFLWFWFTLKALQTAVQRNFTLHQKYMIRSYALTFSAITLRTWKIILLQVPSIPPSSVYVYEAWIGFLPNLVIAELIIFYL